MHNIHIHSPLNLIAAGVASNLKTVTGSGWAGAWNMTDSHQSKISECKVRKSSVMNDWQLQREKQQRAFIMTTGTAERCVPARLALVNPCHPSLLFLWSFSVSNRNRMHETVCTLLKPHRDIKTGSAQRRRETAVQECDLPAAHGEWRFTAKLLLKQQDCIFDHRLYCICAVRWWFYNTRSLLNPNTTFTEAQLQHLQPIKRHKRKAGLSAWLVKSVSKDQEHVFEA